MTIDELIEQYAECDRDVLMLRNFARELLENPGQELTEALQERRRAVFEDLANNPEIAADALMDRRRSRDDR